MLTRICMISGTDAWLVFAFAYLEHFHILLDLKITRSESKDRVGPEATALDGKLLVWELAGLV